jgi:hypothetical protein
VLLVEEANLLVVSGLISLVFVTGVGQFVSFG